MSGKVGSTDDQTLHIKSAEPGLAAFGTKTKTRLAHPPRPARDRPQHLPGPPGAKSADPPKSRPPGERETFALRDDSPTTAEAAKLFSESPEPGKAPSYSRRCFTWYRISKHGIFLPECFYNLMKISGI